jgi:cyclic dehypoxanthinyl futalosine synthase
MINASINTQTNPYALNCESKNPWREFEEEIAPGTLPMAAGFQEAPTLAEINARDSSRQSIIAGTERPVKVHDELMRAALEKVEDAELKSAYLTSYEGKRLSGAQGQKLLDAGDLNILGWLATRAKERFHPGGKVSFLIDRNINYTNICRIGCDFCAFYRRGPESDAYVLPKEQIFKKIEETIELGGTGTLMQGGVNPHLKIEYYEDLFRSIKERYKIHLHALSVIEIEGIAQVSRLTVEETLQRLKTAGLDSIPGAGAEILSDEIRLEQSPVKRHSHRWIKVMQEAHKANLPTTATMMFGALEERKHIIEHILRIRDAQDETQGFYAFILWTFQGENTELAKKNPDLQPTGGVEYLRVLAVSRLMMDNIPNIQGSWVTMGPKIGQISLHYGANDMGSIMIEENVVSAAGTSYTLDRKNMIELIRRSGFTPVQRDTYYNILAEYPESQPQ